MKFNRLILCALLLCGRAMTAYAATPLDSVPQSHITPDTQCAGAKAGYLGDSMSVPDESLRHCRYYNYLSKLMGIEPYAYAVSGFRWSDLLGLAERMRQENPQGLDAIFIWAGTNDFNASVPIGDFFTEDSREVNVNGRPTTRKHRNIITDDKTFCGSINKVMTFIKINYPDAQVILLTPIHRGYARFSDDNVQPPEDYANGLGLYINDYVDAVRRAGEVWSAPVIDLYSLSGLLPAMEVYNGYIQNPQTDCLHPDNDGHYRIARTVQQQLAAIPCGLTR